MTHQGSPLDVPELLDRCIHWLEKDHPALRICSLVHRTWLHPARSRLFRAADLTTRSGSSADPTVLFSRCMRLLDVLRSSPHIVQHIRRLDINAKALATEFDSVADLPFAHVRQLVIRSTSVETAAGIQRLVGIPTLEHLEINSTYTDFGVWFASCSPALRCVELHFSAPEVELEGHTCTRRVPLHALKLFPYASQNSDPVSSVSNLIHSLCIFDFSRLKILSTDARAEIIEAMTPFCGEVEVFELRVNLGFSPTLSFSSFPNLRELYLDLRSTRALPSLFTCLCSIPPSNNITRIVITAQKRILKRLSGDLLSTLDATLSSLDLPHLTSVHLALNARVYEGAAHHMGKLIGRNLLSRVDEDGDWFQSFGCAWRTQ
ncbi:hypothetical protein FB45DRAFT_933465 [Roridomyces roridus]|uniref:Uncharacterized protein n=1 Tax=Roridomyces roridus TaxID=1738132 RepID=A0AAD7BCZ5_9AGAR|nr:hypothetical protein FB45DRAFT_933465 [Roridomyces roridus]